VQVAFGTVTARTFSWLPTKNVLFQYFLFISTAGQSGLLLKKKEDALGAIPSRDCLGEMSEGLLLITHRGPWARSSSFR
jgi:hypothetical protein